MQRAIFTALFLLILPDIAASVSTPAPGVGYDRVVAVVIGISEQTGLWRRLPNAVQDADRFGDLLATRGATVIRLRDDEATESAIYEAITETAPKALGNGITDAHRNLLIVYFVGHGSTTAVGDEGYLVPYGAGGQHDWISMRELDGLAGQVEVFRHQLFLLASCFGGRLLRNGPQGNPGERKKRLAEYEAASLWLERGLARVARVGLTAGDKGQRVPDGRQGWGSPFGNALVNAFEKSGGAQYMAADFNGDNCVSSIELAAYVEGRGRTSHNSPRTGTLEGDDQGIVALCGTRFAKVIGGRTGVVRPRGDVPSASTSREALLETNSQLAAARAKVKATGKGAEELRQAIIYQKAARKALRDRKFKVAVHLTQEAKMWAAAVIAGKATAAVEAGTDALTTAETKAFLDSANQSTPEAPPVVDEPESPDSN